MTTSSASWALVFQTFGITLATIYLAKRFGLAMGWVDRPTDRKIHREPIVTVGGLGIFAGLLISFLFLFLWSGDAVTKRWSAERFVVTYKEYAHLCLLFVSTLIVVGVGIWDDLWDSNPWVKLLFQILAAAIFVGFRITSWSGDLQLYYSTLPLSEFLIQFFLFTAWIVLMLNAINLVDGMDGLAAGIVGIASFWLLMANRPMDNHFLTWTSSLLLGACLAFLVYNFHPASIFMGDTGALTLGLWLGAGSIEGDFTKISGLILAAPIVLLGIPILEVVSSAARRYLGGGGIFQADSKHMHHRLLNLGFRHRSIVLFYYGITFLLGIIGFLLGPSHFDEHGPVSRLADPNMLYGILIVTVGAVFMGYTALVAVERRFENAIREITEKYEKGLNIEESLHKLVDEENVENE